MYNFKSYSKYYDLLYKDKNYEIEAEYICKIIQKYRPMTKELLELGCGSGNHALYLCQKGFSVTGIDRSEEMIKTANDKHIMNFIPILGDITEVSIDFQFDCTIAMFHVISYITENKNLLNCFKLTREHLKPDGLFIFDVWYSPAVYYLKPENKVKRMSDDEVSITRIAQPEIVYNKNLVIVDYEVFVQNKCNGYMVTIREQHPMRHFSIPEIELLADYTGFEVIGHEEYLTGQQTDETTWGVCFILKAKQR